MYREVLNPSRTKWGGARWGRATSVSQHLRMLTWPLFQAGWKAPKTGDACGSRFMGKIWENICGKQMGALWWEKCKDLYFHFSKKRCLTEEEMVYDALQIQTCFKDYKVLSGGRVRGGHQDLNYLPGCWDCQFPGHSPVWHPLAVCHCFAVRKGAEGCHAWHHNWPDTLVVVPSGGSHRVWPDQSWGTCAQSSHALQWRLNTLFWAWTTFWHLGIWVTEFGLLTMLSWLLIATSCSFLI